MRRSKFSEKQIIEILKEIEDGIPVVETLRNKGVSKDTYYKQTKQICLLLMLLLKQQEPGNMAEDSLLLRMKLEN